LTGSVCSKHPKGCCWSESNSRCYDAGDSNCKGGLDTTTIVIIGVSCGVVVILAAVLIPVSIYCCRKEKKQNDVEMNTNTIVVLPEGQPSMVVQDSVDAATVNAVSIIDDTGSNAVVAPIASVQDMQDMIAQQQLIIQQQQMINSGIMNPMMSSMMGTMGMAGMGGMNTMGMDMNSMAMTGGMNSMNMTGGMNSMNMTGGMNGMNMTGMNGMDMNGMNNGMASQQNSGNPTAEGTV